ncbi:peptidase M20, partial [Paenibacillus macerans]|nr:peptidase M20 [Paenibacillus macerans]
MDYQSYFSKHREQHLNELGELLKIPSVSALSEHKGDVLKAAEWIADALRRAGMEGV